MKNAKRVYSTPYLTLFDDGTIGISDGVGYLDTMEREDVRALAEVLHNFFKDEARILFSTQIAQSRRDTQNQSNKLVAARKKK